MDVNRRWVGILLVALLVVFGNVISAATTTFPVNLSANVIRGADGNWSSLRDGVGDTVSTPNGVECGNVYA